MGERQEGLEREWNKGRIWECGSKGYAVCVRSWARNVKRWRGVIGRGGCLWLVYREKDEQR